MPSSHQYGRPATAGKSGWAGALLFQVFVLLLLGVNTLAHAGEFCSTFPEEPPGSGTHVIDGSDPATVQYFINNNVTQITVDTNCTFRNWDPLTVTINFQTPAKGLKPVYLIIFDNVRYTGNMACANVDHKIWLVNGTSSDWSVTCQDLFIPVEAISKQVPAGKTTVGIGEAFTYSLIIPVLYDPASGTVISNTGTDVDVHSVVVTDDLNATGADLTVVGTPTVTWVSDGTSVPHTYNNSSGLLTFTIDPNTVIPAGSQIKIDITVVPDSTNVIGTTFFNTASWQFGRVISLDPDGDGVFEDVFFEPLPGENGVSPPLTIGAPVLTMDKKSLDTTLSPGGVGNFILDVQNTGSTDAWQATIVDRLPESGTASMCGTNPDSITPVTAAIYEADGTTLVSALTAGVDFTVDFTGSPTCELTLLMTGSNTVIGPGQRLIINYRARLEPGATLNGEVLTNVAGATQWFSAESGYPRTTFTGALTDGTPADSTDNQDSFDVTVGLAGYYFQKTVDNLNTGARPATTAQAGDTLRYRLRVFNVNQNVNGIQISDQLDPGSFDFSTFSLFSAPAAANVSFNAATGLLTIDGGAGSLDVAQGTELVFEFDITTLTSLQNNDVVSNQALLSSTSGNNVESDDPFVNGVDDPQDAIDAADPTDVVIQQPGSLVKGNGPGTAVIGDTFTYTITVPASPVAVPLYDVRILDTLGTDGTGVSTVADVVYVNAVASGGSWTLTNTGTANSPVLEDLGAGIDIPAGGQVLITLTARLDNTLTNQAGVQFYNTATYTYNRTNGVLATQSAGGGMTTAAATTILEPGLATFTKVADNTTPTVGQTVHYTVTMTAQSGANTSDVFDVTLEDTLDLGLSYVPGSATVSTGAGAGSGNAVFSTNVTGDGITTPQTLIWTTGDAAINIQAGDTVTLEYDVQVLNNALANQSLNNSIQAQWTSIDGINSYERTGVDGPPGPGVLNDYATAVASATLTIPDLVTTVDKVRSSDTYGAGDEDVRIGDIVEYTLTIPVPEGTLGNLQLVDTLPQGLDYLGVVSINGNTGPDPFISVAPFVHADIPLAGIVEAGNPATGPSTVTWSLGDVSNPYNDGLSDNFVIVYQAQVLNDDVLAQVNSTPLNNSVTMSYDTGSGTVIDTDNDTVINVLQPDLTVNKTASPANGDVLIDAGEVITYTVDIVNSGAAPAYDTVLEDIIPVGLRGAGVSTVGITRHTTSSGALVATLAPFAPVFNGASGLSVWDFDSGVADAYTIPVGETLRIIYTVTADAGITQGLALINAATATLYYSFDDEDVPTGAVADEREIYGPTNTSGTTLYTGSPPTKVLDPAISEAPVGQEVVYHITVPGTVAGATLYDVLINDTLDPALEYVSATDVSGNGFGITDNTAGNNVSLGLAQIPAGQQAVIELRARVANNTSANAGTVVTNIAGYTYAFTAGGTTQPALSSTVTGVDDTFTIVEPLLTINKTVTNATNPGLQPVAGDVLRYTLDLPANGGAASDNFSDAFDLTLNDNLGLGLAYQPGSATVTGAGNTIIDPAVVGDGVATPQVLSWSLADATADIDVVEGTSVTVTYDVLVLNGVLPGQSLDNSARAQWTSLDGADANERDGSNTPAVNDYFTTPVTTSLTVPDNNAFAKTRLTDTFGAADASVRVGDIVEYRLGLTLQEGTTPNVVVTDILPQGLAFEEIASINGDTSTPYSAVAPFSHADITPSISGDPVTGPSTLTLNIGDIVNVGDGNPANDEFVIIYRARVLNDVLVQVPNASLGNAAALDYTTVSGPVTLNSSYSVTLQQPVLSVSKSAAPANGDPVLDAGELVTYTVDILNSGAAPAYDVVLRDVIPVGLRNGAATITMVNTELVVAGTPLANPVPTYDASTGIAVWNLDTGVADTYTIPAGDTLRVVYQVQADANLGPGLTMTNSAQVQLYYSFDNEAVPVLGGVVGVRQVYGPTPVATQTLTTTGPVALEKQITQTTAAVGVPFTYRIVIPETPQSTALNDVRILDDLSASTADLSFVSVSKVSGSQSWTPVNTGSATSLVIEDTVNGIDIPAGEQVEIDITVVLNNSQANFAGLVFNNTADYTFNQVNGDVATLTNGLPDTSPDMTIVAPDDLTLEKSGPATLRIGIPGGFTLDIHNTGSAPAYDLTVTDLIPDPVPGGMCDTQPDNFVAQITLANGTPVGTPLALGTDYSVNFVPGSPTCTLTFTIIEPSAALPADHRLIITYDAYLDNDAANNTSLTNIAGVTEWFSGDTQGSGATGQVQTYTRTLSNGTPTVLDHEDAYTLLTELPVVSVTKTVSNLTARQSPATTATPGDTLRYEVTITNVSDVVVNDYSLVDEVDGLNALPMFVPGTLGIFSAPAGADTTNTDANGGTSGTGLLDIRGLSLAAQGDNGDTATIVFDITLVPSIAGGTVVLNQAGMIVPNVGTLPSDDPNVNGPDDPNVIGDEDPTAITIVSAPLLLVQKISDDLTGSATDLQPGDTLRYTITVKNIGTEDMVSASLRDLVPANTSYVANSTTLNGAPLNDPSAGVSPLESGIPINAPGNTTAGTLRADASATTDNVATITFEVTINANVVGGTIISNQAFVNGDGSGSGPIVEKPSDDPATVTPDDPTLDIVGNLPLVDSQKTVAWFADNNTNGIVDSGDWLRYTITITNSGPAPATGVRLVDAVPVDTTYLANTVYLNGIKVPLTDDGGVSPLVAGIDVSSANLPPPVQGAGNGELSPGGTATVIFDVEINAGVTNTIISNQGMVYSIEQPVEPTDADGNDSNGDQPTQIAVGGAQQLNITKQVTVIGGGTATAGGQLEYAVTVTNIGLTPATDVIISDSLDLAQMSYVAGSATLNGSTTGTGYSSPVVSGDYSTSYGDLPSGQTVTLRFRVQLDAGLAIGGVVQNTADVTWNSATQNASASASVTIGGSPGSGVLSGRVWHDADFDNLFGTGERALEGWGVQLYRNSVLLGTVFTDVNGVFSIPGVAANDVSGDQYVLRYTAPGAGPTSAKLGLADSTFTNGLQVISGIAVNSNSSVQDLNLPIDPDGVVYNSILRSPVAGATVTLQDATTGIALPQDCFDDPAQQNQVTLTGGYYKFDINFNLPECQAGGDYLISVTPPASGYTTGLSVAIPPQTSASTAAYSVPGCSGDAVGTTPECEATGSENAPPQGASNTNYYLKLTLGNGQIPADSQLFNNHVPIDPVLDQAVTISKVSSLVNVSRGELVPYTITVLNTLAAPLPDVTLIDNFPAGFKYVADSARINGVPVEPVRDGLQLRWDLQSIDVNTRYTIKLLLVVGAGVKEGEYINRAWLHSNQTQTSASSVAAATVRVVPDPDFDCSDIIGKVFDDRNINGQQDEGESGIAGVRLATARGLLATTDEYGRFHITCASVPDEARGSNFILKLDDRTLPTGYRLTTENPRVQRITRGKNIKFNFGATVHRVVTMDVADGVFEHEGVALRPQWASRLDLLIKELQEAPSILRLTYLADIEADGLVDSRLEKLIDIVDERWMQLDEYPLVIEKEVYWRHGGPVGKGGSE